MHLDRGARGDERAGSHGDEVVAVAGGLVEVVEHQHDRAPVALVQVDEQVEDLDLVGEVEVGGGFVEQHQVGALRERHRDPHTLALPARQLVDRTASASSIVPVARMASVTTASSAAVHCRNHFWCG